MLPKNKNVIVVGGGLAGLSACHTVLENGGNAFLLDKMAFCGGNSTKATSGINGALTKTQKRLNIPDSPELFEQDSLRGGAKNPELIHVLTFESASGVDWLVDKFGLDLSLLSMLGGHSQKRTHRGKARFPGMTITYALLQKFEEIAEKEPDRAKLLLKCDAKKLVTDFSGNVVGLEYEDVKTGKMKTLWGSVILSTGGFAADFSNHCTGDGIKMALDPEVGAAVVDMEWVQVHPTGLVQPDDPDAKQKFLAAEALRGVGGILIDANGRRFANELGRRDYVTGEMWKNGCPPFRLCLNTKASNEILWHCKHYKGRRLMKFYNSGTELAREMKIDPRVLEETLEEHNRVAELTEKNAPDSGPYDSYPVGKSYDKYGKKFFHNMPTKIEDSYHVALVCPVLHYTMGGLKIDVNSQCLRERDGAPIRGLFGAGEINGGIHGQNRLGGNSLLDCVVFGRVAGRTCCKELGLSSGESSSYRSKLVFCISREKMPAYDKGDVNKAYLLWAQRIDNENKVNTKPTKHFRLHRPPAIVQDKVNNLNPYTKLKEWKEEYKKHDKTSTGGSNRRELADEFGFHGKSAGEVGLNRALEGGAVPADRFYIPQTSYNELGWIASRRLADALARENAVLDTNATVTGLFNYRKSAKAPDFSAFDLPQDHHQGYITNLKNYDRGLTDQEVVKSIWDQPKFDTSSSLCSSSGESRFLKRPREKKVATTIQVDETGLGDVLPGDFHVRAHEWDYIFQKAKSASLNDNESTLSKSKSLSALHEAVPAAKSTLSSSYCSTIHTKIMREQDEMLLKAFKEFREYLPKMNLKHPSRWYHPLGNSDVSLFADIYVKSLKSGPFAKTQLLMSR